MAHDLDTNRRVISYMRLMGDIPEIGDMSDMAW
jgi:hypothetical protein